MARDRGKADRALQLFEKAAALAPADAGILCDLGNLLKARGDFAAAVARHEQVLALMPDSPLALGNLAAAHNAAGNPGHAVPLLRRALALAPGEAELHYNLGNAFLAMESLADAIGAYDAALRLRPAHAGALLNLGVALKELGELGPAAARFSQAIAQSPGNADAHWNLGLSLLAQGKYADGWTEYEWRRRIAGFSIRDIDGPEWTGDALAGRTLLVHAEQGLGDTFQFARYLALLAGQDGDVIFQCPRRLMPLLARLGAPATLAPDDEAPPRFGVHAPLLSLPHLLKAPEPAGDAIPYLTAAPERVARWRNSLGSGTRVGFCWQGSTGYKVDRRRSIPLRCFAPILDMPGIDAVSLQAGTGIEQIAALGWAPRLKVFPGEFDADGAFVDTAAVIASLDLVVTSDTSVAHLAGAMGVDTWLLLCHVPDWRWGLAGGTTPWYPSMRLFRQHRPGDWDSVFHEVARALPEQARRR